MTTDLHLLPAAEFPRLLREIPQPPAQLYVRGELPSFEEYRWLAVVGSRAVSAYGRQVVSHLIKGLVGYPVVIVSGLAYGIDALAHKAALEAGLPTIAVPGSGLDWNVVYPRANVALAHEILDAGGAMLSEFDPGQRAADYTFPRRNRIMAGMCHATLVVEAQERSGSLITARLATDYNRELLVVPGSIFSDTSRGTHQFLKLGATPITEAADILRVLGIDPEEERAATPRADLTPEEIHVLGLLSSPVERDTLLTALALPASEANVILSVMEIKGLIVEEYGRIRRS
ncbi:DNA-protecting protein DprA [Candidatus Kaiserbacteria bacterium]|nr:DNA-protecting protein DprA [Candidatus Kaiserbacteria bacterium]